uniref:Uncharacterized protein n=1 Tax=Nothobranchius kadleci TaxID=1051664 RepID=A0A1A8E440_NOTKA
MMAVVCSDSAAALRAVAGMRLGSRPNLLVSIRRLLCELQKQGSVVGFIWVLGHCGQGCGLFLVGKHPDGRCVCGKPETVSYVLLSCCRYEDEWRVLFGMLGQCGMEVFSVQTLLEARDKQRMKLLTCAQWERMTGYSR